jgi:hypothetical protein
MDPTKLEATKRLVTKLGKKASRDVVYKVEDEIARGKRLGADLKNQFDNTKDIIKYYKAQKNPEFLSKDEEEMLTSIRNIGGTVKDPEINWNPEELKNILVNKARNLSDKQFVNLTGRNKSEILDFIHTKDPAMHHEIMMDLKNTSAGVDEVNWGAFKKQSYQPRTRTKRPNTTFYEREPGLIKNERDPYSLSGNVIGPNLGPKSTSKFAPLNLAKNFNSKLKKFLDKRLNLESEETLPQNYKSLIGYLNNTDGKKKVFKEIREATGRVNVANEGDAFIPSSSLSTDSYPLSYNIMKRFLNEGKGTMGYHGETLLNSMGQLSKAGFNDKYSIKEINSLIKEIKKSTGKNIPYAYLRDNEIIAPKITFTRNAVKDAPRKVVQSSKSSGSQAPSSPPIGPPAPTINLTRNSPPPSQLAPPPQTVSIPNVDDIDNGFGEAPWPPFKKGSKLVKYKEGSKGVSLAFSRGEKDPKGGLTQKGVDKYNRATGGNLKMAVTTPPSKLKAGSKAANRRKSFCARMSGVKGPMTKPNGKPSRKALALRKWNC